LRKRRGVNRTSLIGAGLIAAAAGLVFAVAPVASAGRAPAVSHGAITTLGAKVGVKAGAGASSASSALPTSAATVFSNFGPGNAYDSGVGWTVSESGSPTGLFVNANGFTPSAGGYVSRIDVALSNVLGTNNATIELAQDSGGLPGAVIRSWSVAGQPPFGSCCTVTTINVSPLIALGAGHQYWLIASAGPNGLDDTWDAWNWTYDGASTGPAMSWDGNSWIDNTGQPSGAFALYGCGKLCKVYP
jgi:hypothetical protein